MGKKITVKTYVIGLIIGIVSFLIINHYDINKFIYGGFIPFCLNFSYVYLKSQKNKLNYQIKKSKLV